jgi:hypothetical protein
VIYKSDPMVVSRQQERLVDLRTIRRNIRAGMLTKERFDEYLRSLPDMSENIAPPTSLEDEAEARKARSESAAKHDAPFPVRTRPADADDPVDEADIADDDDDDDDDDDEADDAVKA